MLINEYQQAIQSSEMALNIELENSKHMDGYVEMAALETIIFIGEASFKLKDYERSNEQLTRFLEVKYEENIHTN